MTEDQDLRGLLQLLEVVPRPPGGESWSGIDPGLLPELASELGSAVPAELASWLAICNGVMAGPGGIYGFKTQDRNLDLTVVQADWPGWAARRWIPIAGDGVGDAYVLVANGGSLDGMVCFVDCSDDPDAVAYVCGSSLARFLRFLVGP